MLITRRLLVSICTLLFACFLGTNAFAQGEGAQAPEETVGPSSPDEEEIRLFVNARDLIWIRVCKSDCEHPIKYAYVKVHKRDGSIAYSAAPTKDDGWTSFPEYPISDPESGLIGTRISIESKYGKTGRLPLIERGKKNCYYMYNGYQPSNPPNFECTY